MKLKYFGHACFSMTFEDGTQLITDPFDPPTGYPICREKADIVLTSHDHGDHSYVRGLGGSPLRIRDAGPHRARGLIITGVESFHDDEKGAKRGKNVMFRVEGDGLKIAHLGDLGHALSEKQIAEIGPLDVLLIPIGGFFTIDSAQAAEIVRQLKPTLAIGMHFKAGKNDYPISDEKAFLALTQGAYLPREIDLTPLSIAAMPRAGIMAWA